MHSQACARVKVKAHPSGAFMMAAGMPLPPHFVEALEHNQRLASCCRHPENHDLEALYSSEADAATGVPDIYVFHCTCGRRHVRFMVGGSDPETGKGMRPKWEVR